MNASKLSIRYRWRRLVIGFRSGPAHLAGSLPRSCSSRWFTVTAFRWLHTFFSTHFTPAGSVLFLLSMMFSMFVMEAGEYRPGHLPPFAILLLFIINMLVGWLWLPPVSLHRKFPGSVMAGDALPVEYKLHNPGRLPVLDARLEALQLPKGMVFADDEPRVQGLGSRETVKVKAEIVPGRRGRYVLPVPRVDSAFPLHLWRWGKRGSGDRRIVVYPSFIPLDRLDMSFSLRYQPGGVALSSHVGASMEFLSCREFRHGDDPRHLHPRSWARMGFPVVREFREEYLCRTALVLDTYRKPVRQILRRRTEEDGPLESAVSLAAAIAECLAREEYLVELFAAGSEIYRFESGRSLAYFEDILDVLSCVEATANEPFDELASIIESEKMQMSSAIFVLLTWNKARENLIRELGDAGVSVKAVLLRDGNPLPDDIPSFVQQIDWRDVKEGRCTEL
ncbi:MAG: DUF58 domain-containing protein [Kiritimatiellia bacterium]|nr:DUF58 domain-containing protein [Kiritimatiellia bacterium]MDP6848115.1 DUF58 domain-containing protein [Kiritimatiellia bacterium]